jgi:hypothetical protein
MAAQSFLSLRQTFLIRISYEINIIRKTIQLYMNYIKE